MSASWIDQAVSQVLNQLRQKDSDSPKDVYVWSDGSVTGPKETTDNHVQDLRLVATFSPNELPTEQAIRETLAKGMRTAREAEADEAKGIAAGVRPRELPGTPPEASRS